MVVNEGSNEALKCGDTLTINKLSTNATVIELIVDIPKYILSVILYFHLSNSWSKAKERDNAYIGQKSGCQSLGLESTLDLLNVCVGVDL